VIKSPYYESKIYVGSVRNVPPKDTPSYITERALMHVIGREQEKYALIIPLRTTKVSFVSGLAYRESGWEIAAINYPRTTATIEQIDDFILTLAKKMLNEFSQHRISIVNPNEIIMLTSEEDQ